MVWNRPGRPKAAAVASLVTHSLGDLGCVTSKVKSAAGSSLNFDGRVTMCGNSTTTQPYAQVIKMSLECKLRYVAKVNGKARQVILLYHCRTQFHLDCLTIKQLYSYSIFLLYFPKESEESSP